MRSVPRRRLVFSALQRYHLPSFRRFPVKHPQPNVLPRVRTDP